jgi:adenylate kinase
MTSINMKPTVVFVGGVPGVGKSTICKAVADKDKTFVTLKFLRCVLDEAPCLSRKEVLENFENLQCSIIRNRLIPHLKEGRKVIFDTHFSIQSKRDPELVFDKHSFDILIGTEPTKSKRFLKELSDLKVPLVLILLKAKVAEISNRLKSLVDTHLPLLSEEIIARGQNAEELCWKMTLQRLDNLKAGHTSIVIKNEGPFELVMPQIFDLLNRL